MTERAQNGMTCSQFEVLLAEALDGAQLHSGSTVAGYSDAELAALPPETRAAFAEHRASCLDCGPLYAEAREGMLLLRALEEVEPPRNLMHNILAVTSRVEAKGAAAASKDTRAGWLGRLRTSLVPSVSGVLRSRFAASFCMAFFSLSLTLSLIGVKVTDIAHLAAHPNELRRSVVLEYTNLQARVMRYYDNMRLVYEVQNRVRELKKAAAPAPSLDQDKGTEQPDQQNLIQPAPGVPYFKEVVQPRENVRNSQDVYQFNKRRPRQLRLAQDAPPLPDLEKLSAWEITEFMRKTEGAQI